MKKILLVEKSAEGRAYLRQMLEGHYQILEASDCDQALVIVAREQVSVVLSDTELPTRSGLFLLKAIKDDFATTEVILQTNHASSFNLLQAIRTGVYDVLVKPIDNADFLLNVLKRAFAHIELHSLNQQLTRQLEIKNQELSRALGLMELLNRSVERLAGVIEVGDLLKELFNSAMEGTRADRGFLALRNGAPERLGLKLSQGVRPEVCHQLANELPDGLIHKMAQRGNPVLIPGPLPPRIRNLANQIELRELLKQPGLLAVPLRREGNLIGLLALSGQAEHTPFSQGDLDFLIQLSNHASLALQKTGIIHQLRRDNNGRT